MYEQSTNCGPVVDGEVRSAGNRDGERRQQTSGEEAGVHRGARAGAVAGEVGTGEVRA